MSDAGFAPDSVLNFVVECVAKFTSLPETQRRQAFRLAIMLKNESPKALRLSAMFDRGEIDGDTLLEMMG